jgi:hypothetical protein
MRPENLCELRPAWLYNKTQEREGEREEEGGEEERRRGRREEGERKEEGEKGGGSRSTGLLAGLQDLGSN